MGGCSVASGGNLVAFWGVVVWPCADSTVLLAGGCLGGVLGLCWWLPCRCLGVPWGYPVCVAVLGLHLGGSAVVALGSSSVAALGGSSVAVLGLFWLAGLRLPGGVLGLSFVDVLGLPGGAPGLS